MRPLESRVSQIVIFQDRVYTAGANRILKPPSFSKYLSWGFSDRSVRIISYEQEKLLSTHENLHDDGTVLCAGFSRDGRILVTGNCIKHYIKVTLFKLLPEYFVLFSSLYDQIMTRYMGDCFVRCH